MGLFLPNGFVNMASLIEMPHPFIIIVGGRGIGKTYGALNYFLDKNEKIFYLRRTQHELDLAVTDEYSPYKQINEDKNIHIGFNKLSKINQYTIHKYDLNQETHKYEPRSEILGYSGALSTIGNIKGFTGGDIKMLYYDEFIPLMIQKRIRGEEDAFDNAYESINRNRELFGKPPLKAILTANAISYNNAIFKSFGLISAAEKMKERNQVKYVDNERGIVLIMFNRTPIGEKKINTALYKAHGETSAFTEMALNNSFVNDSTDFIKSQPLIEYRAVVKIGDITIYKHKSDTLYYVSEHSQGNPVTLTTGEVDIERFNRMYGYIIEAFYDGRMYFENQLCQVVFTDIL